MREMMQKKTCQSPIQVMGNDDSGYLGCFELGKRMMRSREQYGGNCDEADQDAAETAKLQPMEIAHPR